MFRSFILLVIAAFGSPVYAQVNEADLAKCRTYSNAAVRSQCVQMYKRTNTRVKLTRCKKSLECWSKQYKEQAKDYCRRAFAMRAARSSLWSQYWSNQDFDQVKWHNEGHGTLLYYEVEAGAVLRCIFNPKVPSKVRVSIGAR